MRCLSTNGPSLFGIKQYALSAVRPLCAAAVVPTIIDARAKLLYAHAVCFDVDSTVITEEGIDVLAEFNGAGEAVSEWTRK